LHFFCILFLVLAIWFLVLHHMIVYNITIKINPEIEQPWLQWQRTEHIPDIMSTGLFTEWKMFRLLDQDESEGITYVLQYFAATPEDFELYIDQYASMLREKAFERWGDQFIAFRSVMELVR
jgi:hypothetical protein